MGLEEEVLEVLVVQEEELEEETIVLLVGLLPLQMV
jgi:hypothetical protein